MFTVDGQSQPGFCLLHRDVAPFLTAALEQGNYKLLPTLEAAGRALALKQGLLPGVGCWNVPMTGFRSTRGKGQGEEWWYTTEAQQAAKHLWFANLNTPEEFAEAERFVDALDT
jgi:molybdopterin-guanine dinucleotide biosynthesis protein A